MSEIRSRTAKKTGILAFKHNFANQRLKLRNREKAERANELRLFRMQKSVFHKTRYVLLLENFWLKEVRY